MARLKTVLEQTAEGFLKAGGGVSSSVKKALRAHRQQQNVILALLAVLLLASAAVAAFLLISGKPQWRQFAALAGIGTGGVLEGLRRVWKDWSQTDLLLIMIEDASEPEIRALTKKLIGRL